jgi:C4-dicarboxylate transporter, DctM subunit
MIASSTVTPDAIPDDTDDTNAVGASRAGVLHRIEEAVSACALLAIVVLPLAEIAGRRLLGHGVPGSIDYVRHLTLWLTLLGAMAAARDGRHLCMTTTAWIPPRCRRAAELVAVTVACTICAALAWTSLQLVVAERQSAMSLAGGVPIYVAQAILPFGFAVIGWRLATRLAPVACAASLAVTVMAVVGLGMAPLDLVARWRMPLLVGLGVSMLLGTPIFAVLAGTGLVLFLTAGGPLAAVPTEIYDIVSSPLLPTIPLFTLAGALLARGSTPERLVAVFQEAAGWLPGGAAVATVLVCAFFTSFTGASAVTILALGGLLYPVLLQNGFTPAFAVGLLTAAGSIGLLFPPSLPVILYGVAAHTPIDQMFLAGLLPGVVMVALVCLYCMRVGWRAGARWRRMHPRAALHAIWNARSEIVLPVVILVSVFGGFATLVEAAALTALYAFLMKCVVQRELSLTRDAVQVLSESAVLVGGSLIVLGASLGLTSYLIDVDAPAQVTQWVQQGIGSRASFLLALNVFLLILGCPMDILSATVVVVPLLLPVAAAYGVHPLHLGVIFLTNLELGGLTPPVGMNLFLSSYRFNQSMMQVTRAVLPFLAVQFIGVLLVTYWPAISVGVVEWLGR